jgi:TolB-like protein/HEAT repeat protein
MNCHTISQALNDGDPRDLSAAARRGIHQHLASCESCANAWYVDHELAARPVPKTPDDLLQRICRSIDDRTARPESVSRSRSPLVVGGLLAIGAAAAATAVWQFGKSVDIPAARNDVPISISPQTTQSSAETESLADQQVTDASNEPEANSERAAKFSPETYSLDANTVVVLPLESDAMGPELAGLSAEFGDQILQQLNLIDGLNVISAGPVAPYTDSKMPEDEIARLFGAGSILVGRITENENYLIINVTHIDAQTGKTKMGLGTTIIKRGGALDVSKIPDKAAEMAARLAEHLTRQNEVQPARQQVILNKQAEFLDTSLSDSERVQALGMLRYADRDARSGAVAVAAVEFAMNPDHRQLRGQVWEYMKGAGDPYLVQPLLQTLAYDSNEYVRHEAANTLEDYIEESGVRDALEFAAANDESKRVRDQALFSVSSEQGQQAINISTILDKSLTDRERLAPLREQRIRNGNEVVLSDEVVDSVLEIAMTSDDQFTRSGALSNLRGANNPAIVSLLLEHLANDSSEHVRVMAAGGLSEYVDHPGVRDALETAQLNDSSRAVRRAARKSIDQVSQ